MAAFHFELVSPDKLQFNGPAESVLAPGSDGDFQVLRDHAPVMTSLRPGVVVVEEEGGRTSRYFVRGGFVDVNPNSKIPALLDRSGPKPIRVFESGSILLYLAEKFGAFLPTDVATRAEALSWLFWQMGSAPYLGGGFGHFYAYAPIKIEYAIDRFAMEVKRQLDVLDRRLAENEYLAGTEYTIADIATFPWYGGLVKGWAYGAAEFLSVQDYKHVNRWADAIFARPAVKRGRMVNRATGDPSEQLRERHDASDFETKTQDKLEPAKA